MSPAILNFFRTKSALVVSLLAAGILTSATARAQNGILREVYQGITGGLNGLTNNPAFPSSPSSAAVMPDFEAPQNVGSNYGQRMSGYVEPPITGVYTFWIASDDSSILYLSSDENPANKAAIASVTGATQFRDWIAQPSQQSRPIQLEEGRRYYIEAIMVEGGGNDHLSVRWRLPDLAIEEPIPNKRVLVELIPPQIVRQPLSVRVTEGQPASFSVQVGNLGPVAFQWKRGLTTIFGATNATLTLDSVALSESGTRFSVVITNRFGTNTSTQATLRVDPDLVPPQVVSAVNQGENDLVTVVFSELVSEETAVNGLNYRINNGVSVLSATLDPDLRTVILRTSPLTFGVNYILTINNVTDRAAQPNPIEPETEVLFNYGYVPLDSDLLYDGLEPLGPSSRRTPLIVSEIMYHPAERSDRRDLEYIELYNTGLILENLGGYRLSGAVDYTFPPGTFISPNEFLVIAHVPQDVQLVYGASRVLGPYSDSIGNNSGTVRLHNNAGAVLLEARFDSEFPWPAAADGIGHSLVLGRPSYGEHNIRAWTASTTVGGSPGRVEPLRNPAYKTIVINEFLAHTDDPVVDFVELFNYGSQPVDLMDCYLTDDASTNKFKITGSNTVIPPLGFLSFDQNQLGFSLSSGGETIFLVNPQQTRVIDAVRFGGQANGVAMGRSPDGAPEFRTLQTPTRQFPNSRPKLPDVVINEIMYHPISELDDDEYVELYNRGPLAVDVGGWSFVEGIDYTFPPRTVISPGNFLVVAKNVLHLRENYSNLDESNSLGDFGGRLSNSGERLRLIRPDTVLTTNQSAVITNRIEILVDQVDYSEGGRWGKWADGGGSSLELVDARSENDFGPNWADSDESGKSTNLWTRIEYTGVLDHGMTNFPADDLHVILLGAGEALLDDVQVEYSTNANLVLNPGFEAGVRDWTFQGNHSTSGLEVDAGRNSGDSLHIRAAARGDTAANRIRGHLSAEVPLGAVATIRGYARWLRGNPEILLRFHGNYLEATGRMAVPRNLGTPGQTNSRAQANGGPAIVNATHLPVLPVASQALEVIAQALDADRIGSVTLRYRLDAAATNTAVNTNWVSVSMLYRGAGYFSATIPGQVAGQMVAFYIEASDVFGARTVFPKDAPERELLARWGEPQPRGSLGVYRIWISQKTNDRWRLREQGSNEELDATFVYGNTRIIYNVGVDYSGSPFHWRGYSGPLGSSANYVMVAPKDDLFLGTTDFVFNLPANLGNDNTAIREQTFYWMAKDLGHPYTHRRFHHLFLNGAQRGFIFEDAQQPNGDYVEEWVPEDPDGELYKIEDWFEFNDTATSFSNKDATLEKFVTTGGTNKLARYRWAFRKRAVEDSASNYASLLQLVDAVNTPAAAGADAYTAAVESLVDVDEWMMAIALRHMTGDWDSYGYRRGKNMYAYKPANGRWQLFHWDVAFAFGRGDGTAMDLFSVTHSDGTIDTVTQRMFNHAPFRRSYYRALYEIANGPMVASRVNPILDLQYNALVANNVNVGSPQSVKDWIEDRRSYILSQLSTVASAFEVTLNNGADLRTNRNYVVLTGTAPVQVKTIKVNQVPYPVIWTSVTSWSMPFAVGHIDLNELVIEGFDYRGNLVAGARDQMRITVTSALDVPESELVINEIHYHGNRPGAEFIELHNTSRRSGFDLTGYRLAGLGFTFTNGTVIPPGGFAVVAQNDASFVNAYGTGVPVAGEYTGRLDNSGETIRLLRPDPLSTNEISVDSVTFENVPPWSTAADGTGASLQLIDSEQDNARVGNWAAAPPTPAATNVVRALLSPIPPVWLSEVQPNNVNGRQDNTGTREPWVELYNAAATNVPLAGLYLTDGFTNLTRWAFPAGTTINAGQFLIVWLDGEPNQTTSTDLHAGFRIPLTTGTVALVGLQSGQPVVYDYLNYAGLRRDRSYGGYPPAQADERQEFFFATPGAANDNSVPPAVVYINEWMASNTGVVADPADDDFDDWFELYNPGDTAVDLSHYTVTDRLSTPGKYTLPIGTTIPSRGYLVIWADEEGSQTTNGAVHASFRLGRDGEDLGLFAPDGRMVDSLSFGPQEDNVSEGRYPDGGAEPFVKMILPTPGSANHVPGANSAPVITAIPPQTVSLGETLSLRVTASDPDAGQALTYSLGAGAPLGLNLAPLTGVITWTPMTEHAGRSYLVTVLVTDDGSPSASAETSFEVTVSAAALGFTGVGLSGNVLTLTWRAEAGRRYRVEYTDALGSGLWNELGEVLADGATAAKTDTLQQSGSRFYRIVGL